MSQEAIYARFVQYTIDPNIDKKIHDATTAKGRQEIFRQFAMSAAFYCTNKRQDEHIKGHNTDVLYDELMALIRRKLFSNPRPMFLFTPVEKYVK